MLPTETGTPLMESLSLPRSTMNGGTPQLIPASLINLCSRPATPPVASGGVMLGCAGGHWVMGTPYKQIDSLSHLPPTIVRAPDLPHFARPG